MPPPSFVDSARRHVPRRTAEGQAELNTRRRPLTRRQRTVLILVDGHRNLEQVLALAMQAGAGGAAFGELVAMGLIAAPGVGAAAGESSVLPSSQTLQGDSNWAALDGEAIPRGDAPLNEARALLVRAVRTEAPLAGALTVMKLKRATTREALEALLDEVEQRLRKPHRSVIAAQTLRHVRHLLTLPAPSRMRGE